MATQSIVCDDLGKGCCGDVQSLQGFRSELRTAVRTGVELKSKTYTCDDQQIITSHESARSRKAVDNSPYKKYGSDHRHRPHWYQDFESPIGPLLCDWIHTVPGWTVGIKKKKKSQKRPFRVCGVCKDISYTYT